MTLGVGGLASNGNTTWSFEQTPSTAAIPKAQSNGEGWLEVRGHGSRTYVAVTAVRICECPQGAGRTTLRVGSTAGNCNTA